MSDYDDLKSSGKLIETISLLKAYTEVSKEISVSNNEGYKNLAKKYEEAISLIEILRAKIDDLEKNKLPTKDEVESMSAMLDVLNKLDIKTLDKISMLGKAEKNK